MAIDIFPKAWSAIPPISAKPISGHPLTPKFGFLFNSGAILDIVTGLRGVEAGSTSPTYSATGARGYAGQAREAKATTDWATLGDGNLIYPVNTAEVTIVLGYQKVDATVRDARVFGGANGTTAGFITGIYVPFSDGIVYWDWANQTTGRVSVSGLTLGDDIWVFTTGPRAQEIWQNGIRRVSGAQGPTLGQFGAGTEQVALGKHFAVQNSDLAKWKFAYVYWRQLKESEIAQITAHPFCWVDPRP